LKPERLKWIVGAVLLEEFKLDTFLIRDVWKLREILDNQGEIKALALASDNHIELNQMIHLVCSRRDNLHQLKIYFETYADSSLRLDFLNLRLNQLSLIFGCLGLFDLTICSAQAKKISVASTSLKTTIRLAIYQKKHLDLVVQECNVRMASSQFKFKSICLFGGSDFSCEGERISAKSVYVWGGSARTITEYFDLESIKILDVFLEPKSTAQILSTLFKNVHSLKVSAYDLSGETSVIQSFPSLKILTLCDVRIDYLTLLILTEAKFGEIILDSCLLLMLPPFQGASHHEPSRP